MRIELRQLTVGYNLRKKILENLSVTIESGTIVSLIGRNGCGKSTLLKTVAGLLPPLQGTVFWNGMALPHIACPQRAKQVAFLPQQDKMPHDLTVDFLLTMGRFPYRRWHGFLSAADKDAIEEAVSLAGLQKLRSRPLGKLSGGERQKVRIAMALVQQPDVLCLDEPTTFLDPAEQNRIMTLICDWNRLKGTAVIQVLHDLNLALRCSHRILAFADGKLVCDRDQKDFAADFPVTEIFGSSCGKIMPAEDGMPCCLPALFLKDKEQDSCHRITE